MIKYREILRLLNNKLKTDDIVRACDYYGAAEPPVRCGGSHLSGLSEPPRLITG